MTQYQLYSTGSNSHGQLALGHDRDSHHYRAVALPKDWRPIDLAFGAQHSLLLARRHGQTAVFAAGSNAAHQIGLGPSEPRLSFQRLELGRLLSPDSSHPASAYEVQGIAACWETSFVHLRRREGPGMEQQSSDLLLSLGASDWGERGDGEAAAGPTPTLVSFAHLTSSSIRIHSLVAGPRHALALLEPISSAASSPFILVGWGASRHGQLGSAPSFSSLPKKTVLPQRVYLPSPYTPADILSSACGKDHSAILVRSREGKTAVVLMGSSRHGQLGPDTLSSSAGESERTRILAFDDALRPALLPSAPPLSAVKAELHHLGCTWSGTYLALTRSSPGPSSSSSSSSPAPPCPDELFAFGLNSHGQLARPPSTLEKSAQALPVDLTRPASTQLKLACGSEHLIALLRSTLPEHDEDDEEGEEEVWAWGWNEHGNLGLGMTEDVWAPRKVALAGSVLGRDGTAGEGEEGEGEGRKRGERRRRRRRRRVVDVWAGNATSWILVAEEGEEARED
ncbi:hypothetical protein JCM1841_002189 [Sporobolomyces salmonicolor]